MRGDHRGEECETQKKKIKRNVNTVGGNSRRKKSIYKKFTDHKNRTKEKVSLNVKIQEVICFKGSQDEPLICSVYMKVNYQVWVLTTRRDYHSVLNFFRSAQN